MQFGYRGMNDVNIWDNLKPQVNNCSTSLLIIFQQVRFNLALLKNPRPFQYQIVWCEEEPQLHCHCGWFIILHYMPASDRCYQKGSPGGLHHPVQKPVRATSRAINSNPDLLQWSNVIYLQREFVLLTPFKPEWWKKKYGSLCILM